MALFVSHSSKDLLVAIEVLRTLHAYGNNDVFLDIDPADGVIAGNHFTDQLSAKHRQARTLIPLVSGNWLNSTWCIA